MDDPPVWLGYASPFELNAIKFGEIGAKKGWIQYIFTRKKLYMEMFWENFQDSFLGAYEL